MDLAGSSEACEGQGGCAGGRGMDRSQQGLSRGGHAGVRAGTETSGVTDTARVSLAQDVSESAGPSSVHTSSPPSPDPC